MKKIYTLLLVVAFIFAFAGCAKKPIVDVNADASSETVSEAGDNVKSDVMPDTASKSGDAVIDINELFEDSDSSTAKTGNSTSQTASSSEVSKGSDSSNNTSTSNITSSTASTAGASQIVGGTDSDTGYTSGWVN